MHNHKFLVALQRKALSYMRIPANAIHHANLQVYNIIFLNACVGIVCRMNAAFFCFMVCCTYWGMTTSWETQKQNQWLSRNRTSCRS